MFEGYSAAYLEKCDQAVDAWATMLHKSTYGEELMCSNCGDLFYEDVNCIYCDREERVFCCEECMKEYGE